MFQKINFYQPICSLVLKSTTATNTTKQVHSSKSPLEIHSSHSTAAAKGEITAFLSLALVLLTSFIMGVLEAATLQSSKNLGRLATDRAIYSVFGEYHKDLLTNYHVFGMDESYNSGTAEEQQIINRMHYYGTENIDHNILAIQYLTDNNGQAFREQVLDYVENFGIKQIQKYLPYVPEWEETEIEEKETAEKESQVTQDIKDLLDSAGNTGEGDASDSSLPDSAGTSETLPAVPALPDSENPFNIMKKVESDGILSVILPENYTLSHKEINLDSQPSYRNLKNGRGSFPARTSANNIYSRLLFDDYLLHNFSTAVASSGASSSDEQQESLPALPDTNTASSSLPAVQTAASESDTPASSSRKQLSDSDKSLQYEVEYMLFGKNSDKANLEAAMFRLFLIRCGINFLYLQKDTTKKSEAEALALTVCSLLLVPQAEKIVTELLLFTWACGESILELRTLLAGQRISLLKDSSNWTLTISALPELLTSKKRLMAKEDPHGFSYKDSLHLMLFVQNPATLNMRCLDRIESNIHALQDNTLFRVDHCVTKLELENTVQIYGNLTYTFPAYFGYN